MVKHAKASEAEVICRNSSKTGRYVFLVKDNGSGFVPEQEKMGVGISSMRDRLNMLGGSFDVHSTVGQGTQIMMEVPADG